jgi:hypothetical protein
MSWFVPDYSTIRLSRGEPLSTGLIFACRTGFYGGYAETTGTDEDISKDDAGGTRALWSGTVDAADYVKISGGPAIDSGTTSDYISFPNILSRYNTNRAITVLAVLKGKTLQNNSAVVISCGDGVTSGWSLNSTSAVDPNQNGYDARFFSAAAHEVSFASIQDTTYMHMIGMVYEQANSSLHLYKNGARIVVNSAVSNTAIANSTATLNILGTPNFDIQVLSAAVWSRTLGRAEISRWYADPLILWRHEIFDDFAFAALPQSVFQPGMFPSF